MVPLIAYRSQYVS